MGKHARKTCAFGAAALLATLAFPLAAAAEEKSGRYSFVTNVGFMGVSDATRPMVATLTGGVDWTTRSRFVLRVEAGRWFGFLPNWFARIGLGSRF